MNPLKPISPEFEQEIQAAMTLPDDHEQEFLISLKKRILDEPIPQQAPRRPLFARPAFGAAPLLALALLVVFLVVGPQRVAATVRGLLGYLPGIGFVEQGTTLQVLAAPVEQERDGIVVTVEQVVADSQRTTVLFTVEGLGPQHRPGAEDAPRCAGSPFLRLPEGLELPLTGGEGEGWPSGYRSRWIFPAIPEKENRVAFMLPCLDDTQPGAAPENWAFELELQPAPPDFQPLPAIELTTAPTSTPAVWNLAVASPTAAQPSAPLAPPPIANLHGIHFQVEKLVELEDGYLLQGSLDWQGTEFDLAYFNPEYLQVRDASGQAIRVEPVQSDSRIYDPYADQRATWTIQTASKDYAGPLTINLPAVAIDQQVQVPFEVDLGVDPQPGQTWELNRTLEVAGRPLTVATVSLVASPDGRGGTYGLSFTLHADPEELSSVSLWDPDNHSAMLTSSGGSDQRGTIRQTFNYDYLPTGIRRIQITQVSYPLSGTWTVSIDLPQTSAPITPVPTQPAACLTAERLAQLQAASPASLPAGLGGRLLLSGPALEGVHFPTLYLMDMDGANKVTVGSGGWADLSPDGKKVIYTFSDGMHLYELESGENLLLSWAEENDGQPLWSPDGELIAFARSSDGIYVARLDGTDQRKVPNTGDSTSLLAWRPDRRRVTFTEKVFGRPAYGLFVANLNGSEKRPVAVLDGVVLAAPAWSPDGRWLLVTAIEATFDRSKETNYLVQPDTCEVIPLTWIKDGIVAWSR